MASEESIMNCEEDLEDGEIESDDECENTVNEKAQNEPVKKSEKSPSPISPRKSNDSKKISSRKERSNQDEDDFMCSIESKIANVLKEKGLEPPMPNIRKQLDPEPEQQQQKSSRSSRKRRKRKERKDQKRDNTSSKKRSKLSDSDNLYMVGGSPDNSGSDSDHSYTSYSSYDSDDYHRSAYEERRNKRREKYSSRNDRDRDRKERRNRDVEKEVCLRFAEYGHCPDDDCQRLHEVRQPKKMELCKFWLMECCAKKEKCSYMHGDFPCKYYYLGLKCINKDCKFMHGKPLSDNLKQILLKHLDTAPKEILGDFPRIGRENATKMISQTHVKLCQEYNIPLPENEKASNKIPALLEMKLNPPEEFSSKSETRKESSRSSRWQQQQQKDGKSTSQQSRSSSSTKSIAINEPGDMPLSEMRGILSDKQIENMASIGVKIVNHINNLTVSQINDIGLSLATIGEIQATAINMHNKAKKTSDEIAVDSPIAESNAEKEETSADVDMRIFNITEIAAPLKSPDTIMSPNQSDMEGPDNKPSTSLKSVIMSPPQSSTIDYSQYLRDSNLNSNDEENEDEPGGLKIDYASDCEAEERKDSQSEDDQSEEIKTNMSSSNVQLLPPSFDTTAYLNSSSVLSKVDISSSIQQLMEKAAPTEKVSHRDPRVRSSTQKPSETIVELSSPTYKEVNSSSSSSSIQKQEQSRRTSIYEIESPSEDEDINVIKLGKDKDMRVPPFLRDSENGDVDFRFPFAPMTNYIPATEIEASFGTHVFNKYEVKIVDIPKPDYSEIKRSFQKMDIIQDPRLKKLCNLGESNQSNSSSNLDPRKRKQNDSGTTDSVHSNSSASNAGTKRLQISTILQNSKHYNDLSSSQKMIVNDILAELSKQLKVFHSDKSSSKIFDTTFITQNPRLSQILIGLGVFVNAEGDFEEIKEMPIATPQVLPNIHQMPPMIPNIMQQPPPNLMLQPPSFIGTSGNLRPGLLGIAPPNLQTFNFDPQDFAPMNSNQNPNFGNEQNFNRNQRSGNNNSSSSNNNNNNFRNNSHHRNNNYRSNRR